MRVFIAALLLVLGLSLGASISATAQTASAAEQSEPDFAAWDQVARRAEAAVEAGRASDAALGDLRAEINVWRGAFEAQLGTNDSRIATIQDQIAALGPAPENAADEAPAIAERRAALADQLSRLSTPRRTAQEAFSRADGIVSEIDAIIRTRQADLLLKRGPAPINPTYWPEAFDTLWGTFQATASGVQQAWLKDATRLTLQDNLPLILVLLGVATALLFQSRFWVGRLAVLLEERQRWGDAGFFSFAISLGQIALPVLGFWALSEALLLTGLYRPRGEVLINSLVPIGAILFSARWLAVRVFPGAEAVRPLLQLTSEQRRFGRIYTTSLGIIFAAQLLLERIGNFERYSSAVEATLTFPLILIAAFMVFRIAQLLRAHNQEAREDEDVVLEHQLIRIIGLLARLIVIVAPLLAAAGYAAAGEHVIFAFVLSLALLAAIALVQRALRDAYGIIARAKTESTGLIPTLANLGVLIASLPLFALIWGAQITDLAELWRRAWAGISIGDTTISPSSMLTLIIVFVVGYMLTKALQSSLKTSILPKTRLDKGGQTAVVSGLGYVGIFLSALIAMTTAGIDLSSLAIVAGALSVGIGFGLQNIVSNFVSGIILLIERPISEGDWIEVGGQHGTVRSISVRSTRIETFDRSDLIVPNSDLVLGTVTNYTRGNMLGRLIISVGVTYGTDTRRVENILREIALSHKLVLQNPAPMVLFAGFGADSLDFEIRVILRDVNWIMNVKNEFNHLIAERFVAEGIEIPFAQRDIWIRNPEALRDVAKEPPATGT